MNNKILSKIGYYKNVGNNMGNSSANNSIYSASRESLRAIN